MKNKFTGLVLIANKPTESKRIYPKHIIEKEVDRLQEIIKNRGWMGQIDCPQDSIIRFANVSHLVTEMFMDGDNLIATIETLTTPHGKILSSLMNDNVAIELKLHGIGKGLVDKDGNLVVGDNYRIISIFVESKQAKISEGMQLWDGHKFYGNFEFKE